MASEKLSYEIAAIYSGSAAVKAALDDFAQMNAQGAKVVNQLQALGNQAQKTGEQIRNSRQGTAQLGMQFNQFATQVAGGTNPLLAMQQQLGDVGYSMSFMSGTAGTVGRFLAGPWGAILIGATAVLSPFIAGMFDLGDSAQDAERKYKSLDSEFNFSKMNAADLARVNELLAEANKKVAQTAIQAANATAQKRYQDQQAIQTEYDLASLRLSQIKDAQAKGGLIGWFTGRKLLNPFKDPLTEAQTNFNNLQTAMDGFARLARVSTADAIVLNAQLDQSGKVTEQYNETINKLKTAFADGKITQDTLVNNTKILTDRYHAQINTIKELNKKHRELSDSEILHARQTAIIAEYAGGKGKMSLAQFEKKLTDVTNAYKQGTSPAQDWLNKFKEADADAKKFDETASKLTEKALPEWRRQLNDLTELHTKLGTENRLTTERTSAYNEAVQSIASGPILELIKQQQELTNKVGNGEGAFNAQRQAIVDMIAYYKQLGIPVEKLIQLLGKLDAAHANLKIVTQNEKMVKSFEDIGHAVSDGFKGMITGAQNFGSAMKNIIGSVIDKLFEMFVVEQIVGFISGGLSSVFKIPLPGKAIGGPVQSGNAYMVGERGPEMFVPSRSGSIVPNGSLGSSGMTINVDARGSADPAAVRAQVQQGILEAAPAIIAAAEQRTVSNLRRPRLGGAMQ